MTQATPLWSHEPHQGFYINSVAISADGSRVVGATFFHDYGSSKAQPESKLAVRAITASAPPASVNSDDQNGTFGTYVWDRSGALLMSKEFQGWQGVYWVASDAQGALVASCGWRSGAPDYAGFIAAYAVDTGSVLLDFPLPGRGNVVALDPNARLLLAGADQGYLFSRDPNGNFAPTPALIALSDSTDTALVSALSADAGRGLIGSYHGEVIVFSIAAGAPLELLRWQVPNSAYLHFAALSSDGCWAYAGANNGQLYAFDVSAALTSGQLTPAWSVPIPGGASTIYGVACSADGSRVAVAGNVGSAGTVAVFDNNGSAASLRWNSSTQRSPNSVSFDAAGRWLALADGHPDGTPGNFYFFDAETGAQAWSYPTSDMSWPIQVSSDASTVAAGSDNGYVYAFNGG
jgi:outer membrane protein assembly factor BamB